MSEPRIQRLQQFVDWSAHHITGDEKGQAQIFLDRLLQAFGQPGLLEVDVARLLSGAISAQSNAETI